VERGVLEFGVLAIALTDDAVMRSLEPWQAAEFAEHVDRIRDHIRPWLWWADRVGDEEAARALLQGFADDLARDGRRIYGIWLRGELVGGTIFRVFEPAVGVCEVGVWLSAEAEGKGLVHRAVRRMIDWAIKERGMQRIEWRTAPENTRSIAAAKRLGMRREGVLRSANVLHGVRHDVEIYAVLADEWVTS
jgi:RimJ/RimL family protein N-acetyltransferase